MLFLFLLNLIVSFVFITETEKIYKCDLVLLAMGFLGPEKNILDELKLEKDPRSNVKTPKGKFSTSLPRVYAAGGRSTVIKGPGVSIIFHTIHRIKESHALLTLCFVSRNPKNINEVLCPLQKINQKVKQ